MSVYKVPQDVEADDKLLGPFSPRQFFYLLAAVGFGGLAWWLSTFFVWLAIIPLPFVLFFGVLALPIRKDQPMEVYLAALISFNLKPNKRIWQPDGKEHLIEIAAPKNPEPDRTKGIRQDEAVRRLSYLADIVDTEGWAIKNAVSAQSNTIQNPIDATEDQNLIRNIDNLLARQDIARTSEITSNMNAARNMAEYSRMGAEQIQERMYAVNPMNLYASQQRPAFSTQTPQPQMTREVLEATGAIQPQTSNTPQSAGQVSNFAQMPQRSIPQPQPSAPTQPEPQLRFNPYPEGFNQTVIQPISPQPVQNSTEIPQQQIQQHSFQQGFPQSYPQPPQPLSPAEKVRQEIMHQKIEKIVENDTGATITELADQVHQAEKEIDLSEEEVVISLR